MDTSFLVMLLSRWAHVGTVIVLVGGMAFLRFAVLPSLQGDSSELVGRIRNCWKKFVHAGILLLLISGFYNYLVVGSAAHAGDRLYHPLIGTKILLAFYLFFLASVMVGRSPGTQKYRDNSKKWLGVMLFVAALIVAISGFVKVRGLPAQAAAPTAEVALPESDTAVEPEPVEAVTPAPTGDGDAAEGSAGDE